MAIIRGVLFDKDGTLLDFEATWGPAAAAVIGALGGGDAAVAADLAASAGFLPRTGGFLPGSPIIGGSTGDFAPAWAARLGLPDDAAFTARVDALFRAASLASLTAYDDVVPVLDALRARGLAIGLATNDSEQTARAHLEALGIAGRFGFVAGYDSGYGPKPDPGMVLAFAAMAGIEAGAVAMVGDSPHDMEAARRAGSRAVGIARTNAAAVVLEGLPDVLVTSLSELLVLFPDPDPPSSERRAGFERSRKAASA